MREKRAVQIKGIGKNVASGCTDPTFEKQTSLFVGMQGSEVSFCVRISTKVKKVRKLQQRFESETRLSIRLNYPKR